MPDSIVERIRADEKFDGDAPPAEKRSARELKRIFKALREHEREITREFAELDRQCRMALQDKSELESQNRVLQAQVYELRRKVEKAELQERMVQKRLNVTDRQFLLGDSVDTETETEAGIL
jgi:chromosome segregation ATPase